MKLIEVEIFDFKSVKTEKLSLNSNEVCLVGINESGKSSLLEAISYLNIFEKTFTHGLLNKSSKQYPNGYPMVCGLFELSEWEFAKLSSWMMEEDDSMIFALTIGKEEANTKFIHVKRWGNGIENIRIFLTNFSSVDIELDDFFKTRKSGFLDRFFNELYPYIEIYRNEDLLIEPASIEELQGNDPKFETFRRLLYIGNCKNFEIFNSDDTNQMATFLNNIDIRLTSIFRKHYKQDESISIRISGYGNKLALVIQDSSDAGFSIGERSPGFQYYFAFLVNKLYLNLIHVNRNIIYLLDEPGNNLHPKGAKDLLKTFKDVSVNNQIIFTTHNPFLVIRNNLDSLVFVSKIPTKGTQTNKKPYLNKYQLLRKELGILLNDSFLIGDINIVVEGNTEKLALHRLFQDDEYGDLQWLNIYNADGVNNVSQALNYLGKKNLNLTGLVLLDSDDEANLEQQKKSFVSAVKQDNWSCVEINDVFKIKSERTFEDLFPQKLYVSAFNQYCHSLKDLSVFTNPYIDFEFLNEIITPITRTLSEHFFSFITDDNKKKCSITKQDVMRILLDNIDSLDVTEKKEALASVHRLLSQIKDKVKKLIVANA